MVSLLDIHIILKDIDFIIPIIALELSNLKKKGFLTLLNLVKV